MRESTKQLKMPFQQANALRENLRQAVFSILIECHPPDQGQPFKLAALPALELAKYVAKKPEITGLVLSEAGGSGTSHPLAKVAAYLKDHCDRDLVVELRGAGLAEAGLNDSTAALTSAGASTIVPATGPALTNHPHDRRGRPTPLPDAYLSAVSMIRTLARACPALFLGAQVNPFKYTLPDAHLQSLTMIRKLGAGAAFLLTQAGWDMAKFQECQWSLHSRGLDEAVLARLRIVHPSEITPILDGKFPGVVMSREFAALLQRESAVSDTQALSAQLRRAALQAAGCRLMGFSGVVVSGVTTPGAADAAVSGILKALQEFQEYGAWLQAWSDFHSHVAMAPHPYAYYAFRGLLTPDLPEFDAAAVQRNPQRLPIPDFKDRLRCRLSITFGADRWAGKLGHVPETILGLRAGDRSWRLGKTLHLPASGCPKCLEEGPCQGSQRDGRCEFGHGPCFYHRVLALANWRNQLAVLESAK